MLHQFLIAGAAFSIGTIVRAFLIITLGMFLSMLATIHSIGAFYLMSRPLMLVSVGMVYILGNLVAWATGYIVNGEVFVWGILALLAIAISIHYVNEYADFETDTLTIRTPFSGGSQVLPMGLMTRRAALNGAWVALVTGIGIALLGIVAGQFNGMALLILSIGAFGGWMYSLPPLTLAWRGWGEVTNAILGGVVLMLYGYVMQTGTLNWEVVFVSIPFALLVFNNLLATTWPDRCADQQVGKQTLATRLSVSRLRRLYGGIAILSVIWGGIVSINTLPGMVSLGSLFIVPFIIWGYRCYTRQESPFPSVLAMIVFLVFQIVAWFWVGIP